MGASPDTLSEDDVVGLLVDALSPSAREGGCVLFNTHLIDFPFMHTAKNAQRVSE